MEKFSAYRDPGTGIQPFLKPVPPLGSENTSLLLAPIGAIIGSLRLAAVAVLALLHVVLVDGLCLIFIPIPPLYRLLSSLLSVILCRLSLLLLGFLWIQVERVTRKRGRFVQSDEPISPKPGDLIVSNWISWVEAVYLAFRFNPIFVLPVADEFEFTQNSSTTVKSPGRRAGTGSAAISMPSNRSVSQQTTIKGFYRASLLSLICSTGRVPSSAASKPFTSLEEIRKKALRPIVVFPECTTSNGRGLLRFAEIFKGRSVPVKGYKVFVACFRCDPPTAFAPSLSHSIPETSANPLRHIFSLTSSVSPLILSVRFLSPSDSPSSGSFMPSEVVGNDVGEDVLTASCAGLISQLGKLKKLSFGWEDKAAFLELYRHKRK